MNPGTETIFKDTKGRTIRIGDKVSYSLSAIEGKNGELVWPKQTDEVIWDGESIRLKTGRYSALLGGRAYSLRQTDVEVIP